jgi:hypothetical protein
VPRASPAGAAGGGAEAFSGVPLFGTAATTSFGLGVILASECYPPQLRESLW